MKKEICKECGLELGSGNENCAQCKFTRLINEWINYKDNLDKDDFEEREHAVKQIQDIKNCRKEHLRDTEN